MKLSELQEKKAIIRAFMRHHYTDARLAQLLDHARDGKLSFSSCCCFIGIVTADHALKGRIEFPARGACEIPHYAKAAQIYGANDAEYAFARLPNAETNDATRIRLIIPMVKAEIRRRMQVEAKAAGTEKVEARG